MKASSADAGVSRRRSRRRVREGARFRPRPRLARDARALQTLVVFGVACSLARHPDGAGKRCQQGRAGGALGEAEGLRGSGFGGSEAPLHSATWPGGGARSAVVVSASLKRTAQSAAQCATQQWRMSSPCPAGAPEDGAWEQEIPAANGSAPADRGVSVAKVNCNNASTTTRTPMRPVLPLLKIVRISATATLILLRSDAKFLLAKGQATAGAGARIAAQGRTQAQGGRACLSRGARSIGVRRSSASPSSASARFPPAKSIPLHAGVLRQARGIPLTFRLSQ